MLTFLIVRFRTAGPSNPGCPTVLIGSLPAACVGDPVTCVTPSDAIAADSFTVLVGSRPAAHVTSLCAHGGTVVLSLPTVLAG